MEKCLTTRNKILALPSWVFSRECLSVTSRRAMSNFRRWHAWREHDILLLVYFESMINYGQQHGALLKFLYLRYLTVGESRDVREAPHTRSLIPHTIPKLDKTSTRQQCQCIGRAQILYNEANRIANQLGSPCAESARRRWVQPYPSYGSMANREYSDESSVL